MAANQRYDAAKNIQYHLEGITRVTASRETSRWREAGQYKRLYKQQGRAILEELSITKDNEIIGQRLLEVVTENRREGSHAYKPGWRITHG